MDGNEQVSAFLAGNLGALAQRNKVIAGAHQLGTEALFSIDLALQLLGDLQYHMLLVNLPRPDRTRVLATMAGVNGNDDVALTAGQWRQFCRQGRRDRLGRCTRRYRGRHPRRGGSGRGGVGLAVEQVDNQAVAVLLVGREGKALGGNLSGQVNDDPERISVKLRRTQACHRCVFQRQRLEWFGQIGLIHIDDDAVRCRQGEYLVLNRARQVENQPRVIRCPPQPYALYVGGGQHLDCRKH